MSWVFHHIQMLDPCFQCTQPKKVTEKASTVSATCFLTHSPICMEISPMAQVALLHTEINSGFRLSPRMGMNSAGGRTWTHTHWLQHQQIDIQSLSHTHTIPLQPPVWYSLSFKTLDHLCLQQVSQSASQGSDKAHSPMQGLTCGKHALVRSPKRAKELCLTSGIVSWQHRPDIVVLHVQ